MPLSDISCSTDTRKQYSAIGVVTNARAVTETRTKGISIFCLCWPLGHSADMHDQEFSQRIHLSDPSYPSADDPTVSPMGHGVTMFAKCYKEWLPSPKQGDILILKGIKQVKVCQRFPPSYTSLNLLLVE